MLTRFGVPAHTSSLPLLLLLLLPSPAAACVWCALMHALDISNLQADNLHKLCDKGMAVLMPNSPAARQGSNNTFTRQQVADTIREVRHFLWPVISQRACVAVVLCEKKPGHVRRLLQATRLSIWCAAHGAPVALFDQRKLL